MPDIHDYAGPIVVTLAYTAVYYGAMLNVVRVKYGLARAARARGEVFDRYLGGDREMLAADRIQLNMLEHMPLFLALQWLNAVFVDVTWATVWGGIYTATRALYPFLHGRTVRRMTRQLVFVATGPSYLALLALAVSLGWALVG